MRMKIADALLIMNNRDRVPGKPPAKMARHKPYLKLSERKLTVGNDVIRISELEIMKVLTSKPQSITDISRQVDYWHKTCQQSLQRLVSKSMVQEYYNGSKYFYSLPLVNPNFGSFCHYDPNRFCQEPEGCDHCLVKEGAELDSTH